MNKDKIKKVYVIEVLSESTIHIIDSVFESGKDAFQYVEKLRKKLCKGRAYPHHAFNIIRVPFYVSSSSSQEETL